ncbi:hypothetical protein AOQ84DRAFT_223398 [Glonium stellatum]|uniref:Annexin A7 n=1 Tax=Glonium stellatum TaxID=574774 RepID=A0A8E2JRW6_9PEZI|nr:hypothetical protein AOQ84DRAFT_223398 [Glonium stellatum]
MAMPTRQWFQPGEGIAREVITADIQRYLGPDALVRPGEGTGEYEGVQGYWITAYRTLTSQMVQDLRLDSQRWRDEVRQGRGIAYQDSRTHQSRQYYGPSSNTSAPAPNPAEYAPPQPLQQQQQQRANYPPQQPHQPSYPAEPAYTYTTPQTGYAQPPYMYDQQGQVRSPPTGYGYAAPNQGQDPHYANAQPRYAYQAQPAPTAPRDPVYPSAQPSTANTYYTADGRPYQATQQPPQANDARRRR